MNKRFSFYSVVLSVFIVAISVTFISMSFAFKDYSDKNTASVQQKDGIYIFMFSTPLADYEKLGTVKKTGIVLSGKPEEMFNILLRRCKKDYPSATGLIFSSVQMDEADAIRFK